MSRRRQVAGVREPAVGRAEPAAEKPDRAAGIEGTRRVASFVVEVVLDEEGAVRRTSVLHVADNEEESWAAWEPQGVVDFMAHRMGPGTAKTFVGDPASPVDSLLLADVEASSFGPPLLVEGGPFEVQATLDPDGILAPEPVEYLAVVHAKRLGSRERQRVGVLRGRLVGPRARLRVPAVAPPTGFYRLEMDVTLGGETTAQKGAAISGGLLQVS